MTWVVAQQFQADAQDIINVAAGGTGSQLETSGGKVRASGTFTFYKWESFCITALPYLLSFMGIW